MAADNLSRGNGAADHLQLDVYGEVSLLLSI
jgi:hypothetical protein